MESSGSACPRCGSAATQPVESVWESRHDDPDSAELAQRAAPPVPRSAATNAGRFYLFGLLGLIGWVLAMDYVSSLVAARAAAVFFVSCVAAAGLVLLIIRIFTGTPRPNADQVAALDEWKSAHREWQRQRICVQCGEIFLPRIES